MMNNMTTVKSELLKEQYTYFRHKSGLSVYVFPKDRKTSCALISTKFGSIDNCFKVGGDGDFTRVPDGVAHFLEHKMFENEDGEDSFEKYARLGANANAFTSFTSTTYHFSCTDNLYESLEVLLRMVFSPYFTNENVKKEQGIIAQEIRMYEDDPSDALLYGMLRCLYSDSSIRINIAGTVESIAEITPEILYKCHGAFYNPQNMSLCVCGKTDENHVVQIIDKVLRDFAPVSVESRHSAESDNAFSEFTTCKMQVSKPLFCIGVKDTDISNDPIQRMKKDAAMQLIASMYFGRSSDFYNELYTDGLISPSFNSWCPHCSNFSFFSLSGDSDDPDEVYRRFKEYVGKIVSQPVDITVFEGCRRAMYSKFIKEFDNTEDIAANLIVDFAVDGGNIFEYAEILRTISPDFISDTVKSLFRPNSFALSTVYPI